MSDEALIACFSQQQAAEKALQEIIHPLGLTRVSLVCRGDERILEANEALHLSREDAPEVVQHAAIGGIIGAAVAVPLTIVTSGLAAVFVGPLAALAGGVVGGFVGVMTSWGLHPNHVTQYEKWIADGKTLLLVEGDPDLLATAEDRLDDVAEEVHLHARTSDDSPEI